MTVIHFAVLLQTAVQPCLLIYFIFNSKTIKRIVLIVHALLENVFIHNAV